MIRTFVQPKAYLGLVKLFYKCKLQGVVWVVQSCVMGVAIKCYSALQDRCPLERVNRQWLSST